VTTIPMDPADVDRLPPPDLHDEPDNDPPCCPTPQIAARRLCGCWGAPGQWIGSAS